LENLVIDGMIVSKQIFKEAHSVTVLSFVGYCNGNHGQKPKENKI
jgi:hypothetical protein